jgi:hypothetical protein
MRHRTILAATLFAATFLQGCNPLDYLGIGGGGSGQKEALVITSDFVTGSFATIRLGGDRDTKPASAEREVDSDAVVRVFDDRVYVVNRTGNGSIQVLDSGDDYATLSNCSMGINSNPHDIALADGAKAYVTLYNKTDLLIVDPSVDEDCVGFILGRIDLSRFADADGIPEMDQMAIIGDRLYVSIGYLDRDAFFAPVGPGKIAVIDIDEDEVIGSITLAAPNPFGVTKGLTVDGKDLLVSLPGEFGVADGGIQRVLTRNPDRERFVITEEELGGDVTDFALVSKHVGYAVISKPDFTNAVVEFDPDDGTFTRTLLNADFIADIELNDRDELYVSDRSSGDEGIRIFDADDGNEITEMPIDVGDPPNEIVFVP